MAGFRLSIFATLLINALVVLTFSGCSMKGREISRYLEALEVAEHQRVQSTAHMRTEMDSFAPESDGRFDAEPAKRTLREFSTDLQEQRSTFAAIEPPIEAEILHLAFLSSYDVALEALELMPDLLGRHEKLSRLGEELERDPEAVLVEIEQVQGSIDDLKVKLEEYIERDAETLRRVEQEKRALRERFGLTPEKRAS